MVYKLTDEAEGVITPEESIASPLAGETEKVPPAILKAGLKETDPSTSSQLLLVVYESAGLSFAVNFKKKENFIGRDVLEKLKNKPLKHKLELFSLKNKFKPGSPLLLHDEPLFEGDKIVGYTTSSNYSFCYKKNICLAYVRNDVAKEDLHIEVEGKKYRLMYEKEPLHDPNLSLMKN